MVGNLSNFTKTDVLRCLLKIEKPVSRSELSEILDLGEGTIRAVLNILKKNGLLESNKQGHYLSKKGNALIEEIKNSIVMEKIKMGILPDKKNMAVHVKSPGKIGKSYAIRDEAVKNGADGALILRYEGKLHLYDSDYREDFSGLENKFDLKKNDVVIVAYADSYKLAEHGALAAAIQLSSELKNIMQRFR